MVLRKISTLKNVLDVFYWKFYNFWGIIKSCSGSCNWTKCFNVALERAPFRMLATS